MPEHDYQPLFDQYPTIIGQMDDEFSSHEFLQCLTQQNQSAYIEALYAVRGDEPFRKVHRRLAQQLQKHKNLIVQIEDARSSINIFGDAQIVTRWRKLTAQA